MRCPPYTAFAHKINRYQIGSRLFLRVLLTPSLIIPFGLDSLPSDHFPVELNYLFDQIWLRSLYPIHRKIHNET